MSNLTTDTEDMVVEDDRSPEQEVPLAASPEVRRIHTQSADPTIFDLHARYKLGDLALDPDYQRHFVWDRTKSSRLVESVLLDVPLPIVYLAEEKDGREEVIDGQQRLTSFFQFLDGEFSLTGLEMRVDLNGKKFATLDREFQRKLQRATLRTVTIKNDSSEDLKFEIFKRLNTGSVALNDQELRKFINAIELSTSSKDAVTTRFDKWRSALQKAIGPARPEPRCFTRALKQELFQADPTCAICNSRIAEVDDAAVDHIEQYWAGGRTIQENARLTHRFCNWSRPRHDRPVVVG